MDNCLNYCGKTKLFDGNLSSCKSCPWGYRVFQNDLKPAYLCFPCRNSLILYDWLYLGFMAMLPLLLHSFFIEYCAEKKCTKKLLLLQHIGSSVECATAALVSLLVIDPLGSPQVFGCGVSGLKDWYTMFYNPTINFTTTIHCTQEAVYPLSTMEQVRGFDRQFSWWAGGLRSLDLRGQLTPSASPPAKLAIKSSHLDTYSIVYLNRYSLPFIYYAFCLLNLSIFRPMFLCPVNSRKTGSGNAVYAALYFYPILTLAHALCAGLVYYSFPYLLLLSSLFSNALHFAKYQEQSPKRLLQDTVRSTRNLCVVLTHWLLYAYCVASFTQFSRPVLDGCLMVLVPVPCMFYIITVGMSDPKKLMVT